ncbi:MAG: urease accessory protein [Paracoccaceae bacterium]|jgi:urease accessory protein
MGAPIRMPTDPASLLTLAQWLSPAFPVGGFSYSHGLEWAVDVGDIRDATGLQDWLRAILRDGAGRNDAILLVAAYQADGDTVAEVDALARALAPSRERLLETGQQGAAFARTTRAIWPISVPDLTYPVAVGAAARAMGLPLAEVLVFYLHGFASNLTSAAIRLIPLGQTDGQSVLATLAPLCAEIAAQAQDQTIDDLGASTFMADIASMKHETQYSRLFQS